MKHFRFWENIWIFENISYFGGKFLDFSVKSFGFLNFKNSDILHTIRDIECALAEGIMHNKYLDYETYVFIIFMK